MYCILLLISKPHTVFGILLSIPSLLRLILALYNFMILFKILIKVMIWSSYLYKKSISICMLMQMHIELLLNAFYIILKVQFSLVFVSTIANPFSCMVLQILIGLIVLIIINLLVAILFSWDKSIS